MDNTKHTLTEKLCRRNEEEVIDVSIGKGRTESTGNGRTGKVVLKAINGDTGLAEGTGTDALHAAEGKPAVIDKSKIGPLGSRSLLGKGESNFNKKIGIVGRKSAVNPTSTASLCKKRKRARDMGQKFRV